jgi:hypothetical protein
MTRRTCRRNSPSAYYAIGKPAMRAGSGYELLLVQQTVGRFDLDRSVGDAPEGAPPSIPVMKPAASWVNRCRGGRELWSAAFRSFLDLRAS